MLLRPFKRHPKPESLIDPIVVERQIGMSFPHSSLMDIHRLPDRAQPARTGSSRPSAPPQGALSGSPVFPSQAGTEMPS